MKKTLVAVGVIVALGVVWSAGAWFTGKQLEGRITKMIDVANERVKSSAPKSGMVLSYQNYKRGFFHSTLQLVVKQVTDPKVTPPEPEQTILFNGTIDHGPFPFTELKKFNLIPAMASLHTELVNNDTTRELFRISKDKPFITMDTRIGYSGATSSRIALPMIEATEGKDKLNFSGGTLNVDVDSTGDEIAISGASDGGRFDTVNGLGQPVQVSFNGIKTEGDSKSSLLEQRVGSQKLTIDKISGVVDGENVVVVEGLNMDAKTAAQEDNKSFSVGFNYSMDALKLENLDMGSGKIMLNFGNIDVASLRQFTEEYRADMQRLMTESTLQGDPLTYQKMSTASLVSKLPLLLNGNPTISVAPLSWKNAKGESSFNLSLSLKNQQGVTGTADTPEERLDRYVKSFDASLIIPIPMATELMSQIAQFEGNSVAESEKLASQQIKSFAAMGELFGITKMDGDNITARMQYDHGKLTRNGKSVPLNNPFSMPAWTDSPENDEPAPQP